MKNMNNRLAALALVVMGLATSVPALAAGPSIAHIQADVAAKQTRIADYRAGAQYQEYTGAMRREASIKEVMRLNNCSRAEAEARYEAAIISQSGAVGVSPVHPHQVFAFNPMYQAWMDLGGNFYAGIDAEGRHQSTATQRVKIRMDNFWYCPIGQNLSYDAAGSVCK